MTGSYLVDVPRVVLFAAAALTLAGVCWVADGINSLLGGGLARRMR